MRRILAVSTLFAATLAALGGRASAAPAPLRLVNYYPANNAWTQMWTNYDHATVDADFASIGSLGANAVRIIVQPQAVGTWPTISARGEAEINDALDTAAAHNLKVQLTLFDWWSNWSDTAGSKAWVNNLVSGLNATARADVAMVDARNEIPNTSAALSWAGTVLPYIGTLFPGIPRTVSTNSAASVTAVATQLPSGALTVLDIHLYGDAQQMLNTADAAKAVANGRPIVIGEHGYSTIGESTGVDQAQVRDYQQVRRIAAYEGIPYVAPWGYSDFTASAIPAGTSDRERYFGLRRVDGTWKPAANVIKNMFSGQSSPALESCDCQFSREDVAPYSGSLGSWRVFDASAAGQAGVDRTAGVGGSPAGYLGSTGGDNYQVPALYQGFLLLGHATVTLSAKARLVNATGWTHLSVAWFDRNEGYLGTTDSTNAVNGQSAWQTLTVTATKLQGATAAQVHLKSYGNAGTVYFDDVSVALS